MEVLFWKVFHNKYLFNIIVNNLLSHLHVVEYDNYKKYYWGNKRKFQDCLSLKWISKEKQFPLLKDKILYGGDDIVITKNGIIEFISNCNDYELIKIVFEKYKLQFTTMVELIDTAIRYDNFNAFKIFILDDEQVNDIPVLSSTIQHTIVFGSFKFIKLLLNCLISNKSNYFYPYVKQQVLKFACSNQLCRNRVIELMLNNNDGKYYQFTTTQEYKIKFYHFILLDSKINKLKLFEFNQISEDLNNQLSIYLDDTIPIEYNDLKFYYHLIFKSNFQSSIGSGSDGKDEINEILLELKDYSNLFYLNYLILNDDIINTISMSSYGKTIYLYTFTFFSLNGLNYLFDNGLSSYDFIILVDEYKLQLDKYKTMILKDTEKIIQFLDVYFGGDGCPFSDSIQFELFKETIQFLIENIKDLEVLKRVIDTIPFSKDYLKIPNLNIESFEIYKWLINYTIPLFCNSKSLQMYNQFNFQVDTVEKMEFIIGNLQIYKDVQFNVPELYLLLNYQYGISVLPQCLLFNLYLDSFKNCDIATLELLSCHQFNNFQFDNSIQFSSNCNQDEIIGLFNYLNGIKYNGLDIEKFISLLNGLKECSGYLLGNLVIDFREPWIKDNEKELVKYLLNELLEFNNGSGEWLQFLVGNQIIDFSNIQEPESTFLNDQFLVVFNSKEYLKVDEKTFKNQLTFKDQIKPTLDILLNSFRNVVSFHSIMVKLYLVACQSYIEFEEIVKLEKEYSDSEMQIEINCYHVFYYITIRFKCLKGYIKHIYSDLFDGFNLIPDQAMAIRNNKAKYDFINSNLNYQYYTLDMIGTYKFQDFFLSITDTINIHSTYVHRSTQLNQKVNSFDISFLLDINEVDLILIILKHHKFRKPSFSTYKNRIMIHIQLHEFIELIETLENYELNFNEIIQDLISVSRLDLIEYVINNYKSRYSTNFNINIHYFETPPIKIIKYFNDHQNQLSINFTNNYKNVNILEHSLINGFVEICKLYEHQIHSNTNEITLPKYNVSDYLLLLKYYFNMGNKLHPNFILKIQSKLINDDKYKQLLWWFK